MLTDQIADLLYTTERVGARRISRAKASPPSAIVFVGNVMIDSLRANLPRAVPPAETLRRAGIDPALRPNERGYGVVTLHRPSNVDRPTRCASASRCCATVEREAAARLRAASAHARQHRALRPARRCLETPADRGAPAAGLSRDARPDGEGHAGAHRLRRHAGGDDRARRAVPHAAREHRAPDHGRAGHEHARRARRGAHASPVDEILAGGGKRGRAPELWDGRAAERIVAHLARWIATRRAPQRA